MGAASTVETGSPDVPTSSVEVGSDTTDQMWSDDVSDAQIDVFQIDGRTYTLDSQDVGGSYYGAELRDGGFYRLVADVTYLNGGVAGYVDYPEIHEVTSVTEISPLDLDLPSIEDRAMGLVLVGDYAEGDLLLNDYNHHAVWKDGAWIWRYDKQIKLEDGRQVLVRTGVTDEDVRAGVDEGTLANEDYFVLPAS